MATRILYVITKANWGGAGRYVYDLATSLPKDKFAVAVAVGGDGALSKKLHEAHIPVHSLAHVQRDLSVTNDIGGFFAIYNAIRYTRPDIVHLNSSKAGGLGALAARLLGVRKIVFTAHGWPFMEKRNIVWRAFAWAGSWVTALLSHTVIVISTSELHLGKRFPFCAQKMRLIHNGIDWHMHFGSGEHIRSAFPKGVRIIGTIGELNENKNQIALIEEARNNPLMYVAIVGEGELRPYLEKKIEEYGLRDRVKLFGFVPAQDVLKGFDEFALPSRKEGLAYVLLEAKAAGLPLRTNRIGGIPDILDAPDMTDFTLDRMVEKTVALYR
ncbi:MAG: glycosyltransferase [Candidatus Paceibacterota bacterium]|jgi:glycosyltransferase involved in cell wall biosynthesis